ncbi:Amidase 1-like protein [Drosera capensis]
MSRDPYPSGNAQVGNPRRSTILGPGRVITEVRTSLDRESANTLSLPSILNVSHRTQGWFILCGFVEECDDGLAVSPNEQASGFCQVSIPLGLHENLPVAVSLLAKHGSDKFLLDIVEALYGTLEELLSTKEDSGSS